MTEDAIAAQLGRVAESLDSLRNEVGALRTDVAVSAQSAKDVVRRVEKLEGHTAWAVRGVLGIIFTWILGAAAYFGAGDKAP